MSDSTKTILWIALAVVVILVIVGVVLSSRKKRRVLDQRRFQAGELRAEAQQKTPLLQESADRASVTERIAADARAEADEKAAAAAALESQAQANRAQADGVRAERDGLAREADRIDPDVTTDDAGHRVDRDKGDDGAAGGVAAVERDEPAETAQASDTGSHDESKTAGEPTSDSDEPAGADSASASDAASDAASDSVKEPAAGTGVLGGASTLDDHDDEPDLADAEDPFTTAGEERPADGYDESMEQTGSTDETNTSDDTEAGSETGRETDAGVNRAAGAAEASPEPADEKADEKPAAVADGSTADESDPVTDDDARGHAVTGDAAPADDEPQQAGDLASGRDEASNGAADEADDADSDEARNAAADEADAGDGASAADGPPVATTSQPSEVSVPALDDRDDVLVAGGPPDNDPGDHRGQPWATTPGDPGLDEGDDVVENPDEGLAAHTASDAAVDSQSDSDAALQSQSESDAASDDETASPSDGSADHDSDSGDVAATANDDGDDSDER